MLRDVSPTRRINAPAQTAPELDIEHLSFEREPGRHFFEHGESGVVARSGDCDIELDAAEVEFFRKLFAAGRIVHCCG